MSSPIKSLIHALLSCENAGSAKPIVDQLVADLCRITNLELHPEFFLDTEASITSQGKAVSTTIAAQCAEDVERTRIFLQGIYAAIEDKISQKSQQSPVEILYAGTGPFGLLLIPLLPLCDPALVQVTLLDIHQISLDKLHQLVDELQLQHFIRNAHCVNACEWQTAQQFDVIISETMRQGLVQEPQVSVFAQLQRFLTEDGILIPEKIQLDLWLSNFGRAKDKGGDILLGTVFQLDRLTATKIGKNNFACLSGKFFIPDHPENLRDLKLTTFIQVYQQHQLTENQSQLTLPIYEKNAQPLAQTELSFHYDLGSNPKWIFNYQRRQSTYEASLPESLEASTHGVFHIKRLWFKTQQQKINSASHTELKQEWLLDRMVLDKLGTGLEPAISALFHSKDFEHFESWLLSLYDGKIPVTIINDVNKVVLDFLNGNTAPAPGTQHSPLTEEQLAFWDTHGYLVIPSVLNANEAKAARDAIWQFLDMSEDDKNSWYKSAESMKKIMVQMFSHPSLEVARNSNRVRDIFKQLWGRDDLVMTTDRVSFNPPETANWYFPGPHLHWDVELKAPIPFGTQGLIYLTDTAENQGAFCCVPGFHKNIDEWIVNLPENFEPADEDWSNWAIKPIAANAGDLIIWHQALPHGSSPNRAYYPRMVQYINMYR